MVELELELMQWRLTREVVAKCMGAGVFIVERITSRREIKGGSKGFPSIFGGLKTGKSFEEQHIIKFSRHHSYSLVRVSSCRLLWMMREAPSIGIGGLHKHCSSDAPPLYPVLGQSNSS